MTLLPVNDAWRTITKGNASDGTVVLFIGLSHPYIQQFFSSTDIKEMDSSIEKTDGDNIYRWRLSETRNRDCLGSQGSKGIRMQVSAADQNSVEQCIRTRGKHLRSADIPDG
jgi:hypothetical protein